MSDWISELEEIEGAATRGWTTDPLTLADHRYTWIVRRNEHGEQVPVTGTSGRMTIADAELIVALRGSAPKLLAIARAAESLSNFAWSAVEADCEEAKAYLQSLIDRLRTALTSVSGEADPAVQSHVEPTGVETGAQGVQD